MRRIFRRKNLILLGAAGLGVVVLGLQGCASLGEHITMPGALHGDPKAQVTPGPGSELVPLETADGTKIVALFGQAQDGHGKPVADYAHRPTMIYFYGSGECLAIDLSGNRDGVVGMIRRMGVNVLIPEYPGYGLSSGKPSERNLYAAADAAYAYALTRPDVDHEQLIIAGGSLGTGVAVDLASRKPARGLVLISPFTSIPDVGPQYLPWYMHWMIPSLSARCQFNSLEKISKVTCPILMIRGMSDNIVLPEMCDRLAAATKAKVTILSVEGAGHGGTFGVGGEKLWLSTRQWLRDIAKPADYPPD